MSELSKVPAGTPVVVGSRVVSMPSVRPGDLVLPVGRTGELVVISEAAHAEARAAVQEAKQAVRALARCRPEDISRFFAEFARLLGDGAVWQQIAQANAEDVASAEARGRSTTRLQVTARMRADMIAGLEGWARTPSRIGEVIERREASDFTIERRRAALGVVAFVFEGRPNVFADGAGVVRSGNAAVMRIGGDALGTALAIEQLALRPALRTAGLPEAAVRLVRSREHGAGQALFTLPDVRLAVARGSGATVALLGAIAEQHGIPASLHGTGGAWLYVEAGASPEAVRNAICHSLDRKVCNTMNVLLLERSAVERLGPVCRAALQERATRVHVVQGSEGVVDGEPGYPEAELGREWEWESTPEASFVLVDSCAHAIALINQYSPHFVAAILSRREGAFAEFYEGVDAPYVSNGFTRWVDGQWAWLRPELGLTNWEGGRLLGRSGFLSGDDIYTIRDVFLDHSGKAPQHR